VDVGRGEAEAEERFRALFADTVRPLLGYVLRRTAVPSDAADVVAETFLVAWRRIDDVPVGGDAARPWLFGVARRVLGNHRRGERRRSRLGERLRQELADVVAADPAVRSADVGAVAAAMARLDEADREVLRLTSWEGLSPAEVAVVMGVPAATARSRLHRARNRLRAELVSAGWDDGERSGVGGQVTAGGRVLAQDTGCDR
jgi:RNA polymerase sigma factor (sigma-70 family)